MTEHQAEHDLIADARVARWLDRDMLLVHLATHHRFTVKDVANYGWQFLAEAHDTAHGVDDVLGVKA